MRPRTRALVVLAGKVRLMDAGRFDDIACMLIDASSRRDVLRSLAAAVGLGAMAPVITEARKKNKRKKKKKKPLQFNTFGCVNVGSPCRGDDANCCSGLCDGNRPKKGKRDTSRCVGHDASTCLPGQTLECEGSDVLCVTSAGLSGQCVTTTGNAGFCFREGKCFVCKKDADCVGACGPQAACITCVLDCAVTGGTSCAGPGGCTF